MTVQTATFRTGKYRIENDAEVQAYCEQPDKPGALPVLYVSPRLSGRAELEAWVHEAMHAHDHEATEKYVTRGGADIARLLWRLGYRREL